MTQRLSLKPVIQTRLSNLSDPVVVEWWLKESMGKLPSYGVKVEMVRGLVKEAYTDYGHRDLTVSERTEVGMELLSLPMAEEKLAGIYYLELYAAEQIDLAGLDRLEDAYINTYIHEQLISDWFCTRVLEQVILLDIELAKRVASWVGISNLWQARSSLYSFVNVIGIKGSQYDVYRQLAIDTAEHLLQRTETECISALGTVLEQLEAIWPVQVREILEKHKNLVKILPKNS